MNHKPDLTYETVDSLGKTPDLELLSTGFRHNGNQKVYVLVDYTWCGESDRWQAAMREWGVPNAIIVTRPIDHLDGLRQDRQPRYDRVGPEDYPKPRG